MDRPVSSSTQQKRSFRTLLKISLAIGVLAGVVLLFRQFLKPKIAPNQFVTAAVVRGTIENTFTATGIVVPGFEEQVNAPISTQIKNTFLTSGTAVQAGDKILSLHKEFIQLEYESAKDQLELRKNNIVQLQLEYDKNLKELDYDNQIKSLQIAGIEADVQDAKRLNKIGGATAEEVERAELALKIARLEQQKMANELQYRKSVSTSDKRNLELELLIEEKALKKSKQQLSQTIVTAPRAGVITWINEAIGKQVNIGDPLVRIADLGKFRIEATCSDRYSATLKVGMSVKVRIDNQNLLGRITSILPAVKNNTLSFIINLDEANNKLLKPNMQVEVFIISNKKENVLLTKNGAGFKGGATQYLFKIQDGKAIRTTVQLGLSNKDKIEISGGGIQEGDMVIISDMKDQEHVSSIVLSE